MVASQTISGVLHGSRVAVVDQNIDAAEFGDGFFDHDGTSAPLDRGRARPRGVANRTREFFARRFAFRGDHHVGSFARQAQRERYADTARLAPVTTATRPCNSGCNAFMFFFTRFLEISTN